MPLKVVAGSTVPQLAHALPFCVIVQLTPALAGSFARVGVNACVIFSGIRAEVGEMDKIMASTVTVVEPDFVASDIEVAVIVTGKFAVGGVEGAV